MGNRAKVITAILLLLVAAGYGYYRTRAVVKPGPAINNGVTEDFGNPQEIRSQMLTTARQAGITDEQIKKMQELREKGDWGGMAAAANETFTTAQREKMRESFAARRAARDAKMRSILGEAQFERYQEKQRGRFGGRGFGGFAGFGGRGGDRSGNAGTGR